MRVINSRTLSLTLGLLLLPALLGAQEGMRVHFLDVGQGDATLIEFPKGAMLVDTGGETEKGFDSRLELNKALDAFFDRRTDLGSRLDLLIVTHPHKDHTKGIDKGWGWNKHPSPVLQTYRPWHVVHNGDQPVKKWVEKYSKEQKDTEVAIVKLEDLPAQGTLSNDIIDPFDHDGTADPKVSILWSYPSDTTGWDCKHNEENENNHSVVVRVDYGSSSILITGDLEESHFKKCDKKVRKAGIERLLDRYNGVTPNPLDVDVYQVGHHGSHNGTTEELVAAMDLKIAVMSHGPPNRKGKWTALQHKHPRLITVQRLVDSQDGVSLCRTERKVAVFPNYKSKAIQLPMQRAVFSTAWDGPVVLLGKANGFWEVEAPADAGLSAC